MAAASALLALAALAVDSHFARAQEAHAELKAGVVVANMDRAVKPGDDFYRYANGDWLRRTEIPANRSYLDADQQFFLGFAQKAGWASKQTEGALRQQVMTDPHAPPEFRVDTVRNLDAWYAAFDVQPGTKLQLAPANRVRIW